MSKVRALCLLSFAILISAVSATTTPIPIAKPCPTRCGNVTIPFPFGLGWSCSLNRYFAINCDNNNYVPGRPFFGKTNIEIVDISINGQMRIKNTIASSHFNGGKLDIDSPGHNRVSISLETLPVVFSNTANKFTVVGCDDLGFIQRGNSSTQERLSNFSSRCTSTCSAPSEVHNGPCSGVGCCETSIPKGLNSIVVDLRSYNNHTNVSDFNPYGYAFLGDRGAFDFNAKDLNDSNFKDKITSNVPIVLDWYVGNVICNQARRKLSTYVCLNNTSCIDFDGATGYRCACQAGYQGNPYLSPGCTDIDECIGSTNPCSQICTNIPGSYKCSCVEGYHGDGHKNGTGCIIEPSYSSQNVITRLFIGFGIFTGSIVLLILGWWLHSFLKKRQIIKQQQINSERNGEMLQRQQMLASDEGGVERIKIFTIDELKKATDDFNKDRELGQGGNGIVYKGMLGEGRIVAVKMCKKSEESQREEFINEVVVMSQISHRNVLKLLGCCLETEVPLLVYEFIPNGTLYQHIHNPSEDFTITWKMRLQIASDTAGALAYLHSSTSTLIFHRDIKSSNILLDDKYRAKLSDFGTSRSVAIDQTHVVTRVIGTWGYMDPEYFQSQQFTEKSDVYSFGVVLVELLTGEKAVRAASEQERSLTSWFLSHMENSYDCVLEIVDSHVLKEGSKNELLKIANLAKRCLHLDGKKRPTMKEVVLEIEAVLSFHMPQTYHPINTAPKFEQASDHGTATTSTQFSTFSLESSALDSPDLSLLFSPI